MVPCDEAHDFALDPAAVEARVTPRTKILAVITPNNPTGAIIPAATTGARGAPAARKPRGSAGTGRSAPRAGRLSRAKSHHHGRGIRRARRPDAPGSAGLRAAHAPAHRVWRLLHDRRLRCCGAPADRLAPRGRCRLTPGGRAGHAHRAVSRLYGRGATRRGGAARHGVANSPLQLLRASGRDSPVRAYRGRPSGRTSVGRPALRGGDAAPHRARVRAGDHLAYLASRDPRGA